MKTMLKSLVIGLGFVAGAQAMECAVNEGRCSFGCTPQETPLEILNHFSKKQILALKSEVSFEGAFGDLRLVCKDWQEAIDAQINVGNQEKSWHKKKKIFFINSLISAYDSIGVDCKWFLNGTLMYKNNPDFVLFIADLEKPFAGEFNLKAFGNAGKYLSIGTGYRKKCGNGPKLEVRICPRFALKRNISEAKHHEQTLKQWPKKKAAVGIFYSWGEWNNLRHFDCIAHKNVKCISGINLLKLYQQAMLSPYRIQGLERLDERSTKKSKNFRFIFNYS